ncbi:MAG: hypothetical protein ACKOAD_08860 [Gammaproteobacteria bacterium]
MNMNNPNEAFKNWSELCGSSVDMARRFAQQNINFCNEISKQVMQYSQNMMDMMKEAAQACSSTCSTTVKKDQRP